MKTLTKLMIITFMVVFCVSCASVSKKPFKAMIEEADSRVGESVILGGYILDSQILDYNTEITVLQTPLDWKTKPQSKDKSEGTFLVSYEGEFNPNGYSPKDRITFTGKIAGIAEEKVEQCPGPCLKIESSKFRIWREYEYYPPPSRGPGP